LKTILAILAFLSMRNSLYPFFIHSLLITPYSLLLTHYFKAMLLARGFKPIFLITDN
jgi:hypothetical protein